MDPSTTIAIAGAAALGAYSWLVEPFAIRVRELELAFPNLPPAFDGYTILHLSDFHLTKMGLLERRLMSIIGGREVDSCVITGDVTAEPRASDIFRRVCSVIRHRDPIFLVLGNSEHKPWLDTPLLVDALSFDGIRILVNSSDAVQRGDQRIRIVGVDDAYSRLDDTGSAFTGVANTDFVIFLTHCPSVTPQAIDRGADLILAGHTHGGQVRIPAVAPLWTHMRANSALNSGLYPPERLSRILRRQVSGSTLFVNRGVGTSRIHIRFLCPPEVVYITLRSR